MSEREWIIQTSRPNEEIEPFLRKHAPWRINVKFSTGLQSWDFGKSEPSSAHPLGKLAMLAEHLPKEALSGRVLDVGHNLGHNSIAVAQRYGAEVVGIDYNSRHQTMANWFADIAGANVIFKQADAETYLEPEAFSLILHLGTLYHLPNPFLAIQTAAKNLKPGGWLALETVAYVGEGAERHLSKWFNGFGGDHTNYWAISKNTLTEMLSIAGMDSINLIKEVALPVYKGEMARVLYVACKRD
jgi:2-polyprenyl-3-methyl-5-hydroxy-6-metoxy-1,4-benzoquinol methylase